MSPTWRERLSAQRGRGIVIALAAVTVTLIVVATLLLAGDDDDRRDRRSSSPSLTASTSGTPVSPSSSPSKTDTSLKASLLMQRQGFGAHVTGGLDGPVVHVSSDADSGPGSLREAVGGVEPRWLVFDEDMTIRLRSPLAVGSNKTLDGRGRSVAITGPGIAGLDLVGASNVIVEGLTLHGFGDPTQTSNNDMPDAIRLDDAHGVWIDHNDLSVAGDKLIAITNGSTDITVSWNHFQDQEQVFQVGNQSNKTADANQTVTVHHNFFDRTSYRNPVVSYGVAHVYNNYYLEWDLYGVRAERGAQIYLENNIFVAGANPRAAMVTPSGDGCTDSGSLCDKSDGILYPVGNLLLQGAKILAQGPNPVLPSATFDPAQAYSYTAEKATEALADQIAEDAGVHS